LRALGLEPQLRAETPTTDGIMTLLAGFDLRCRRIGVQLYPDAPNTLAAFLDSAGARVDPVTPYAYADGAPDDVLDGLIERIASGDIDAVAFTSAPQARRLFDLARKRSKIDRLTAALRRTAVAAVGPVVAAELERHGISPAIVPAERYFMKPLVTAMAAALGQARQ
jgi:uroporphyrinogen-III synthase